MSFAHFIARRILSSPEHEERLSRPIVTIAVAGIVVGMAVMILTVAITSGFQRAIRTKVADASAHMVITSIGQMDPKETPRVPLNDTLLTRLRSIPGVRHIQAFATKPGIIETPEEIQGVVVKGIGPDQDPGIMGRYMVEGVPLALSDTLRSPDVLISLFIAQRLRIALHDTITIYLVKGREDIRPRKFTVCGIYQTGIERIDHQLVIIDIGHLQRFSGWGLQAEMLAHDTCTRMGFAIEGLAFGGDRSYSYDWPGTDLNGRGPHWICASRDTTLMLVVHDDSGTLPDTAWMDIQAPSSTTGCLCGDDVTRTVRTSGGSHRYYVGGFEVSVDRFEDLARVEDAVYRDLPVNLKSETVSERFPEIFAWLELLDTNVLVVIVLMIIVAVINMASALLIIILERTRMIGVLKALGATNGGIRKIFLIDAAYILGVGVLLGDLLGVGLCLLQQQFGWVRLPIESYYVDVVPISLDLVPILLLNIGTLAICLATLILPSYLVTRITPVRAIRFD